MAVMAGSTKRTLLCTWTQSDGDRGTPARRLRLGGVSGALLQRAFVVEAADAPAWRRSGRTLHVYLRASCRPQTSRGYEKAFNGYRLKELEAALGGRCRELSGCQYACWTVEFECDGWSDERIDKTVRELLDWHNREVARGSPRPWSNLNKQGANLPARPAASRTRSGSLPA